MFGMFTQLIGNHVLRVFWSGYFLPPTPPHGQMGSLTFEVGFLGMFTQLIRNYVLRVFSSGQTSPVTSPTPPPPPPPQGQSQLLTFQLINLAYYSFQRFGIFPTSYN